VPALVHCDKCGPSSENCRIYMLWSDDLTREHEYFVCDHVLLWLQRSVYLKVTQQSLVLVDSRGVAYGVDMALRHLIGCGALFGQFQDQTTLVDKQFPEDSVDLVNVRLWLLRENNSKRSALLPTVVRLAMRRGLGRDMWRLILDFAVPRLRRPRPQQ